MSSSQQDARKTVAPRQKKETPEEVAFRWQRWRRIAILSLAGIVIAYYAWTYLISGAIRRMNPAKLPDEVPIEEVAADFKEDPEAAAKKYANKRIVVVGKLVRETAKPNGTPEERAGRIYYVLAGEENEDERVYCEFFDIDDAGTVESGDSVRLSGVIKDMGGGKLKLIGAGE